MDLEKELEGLKNEIKSQVENKANEFGKSVEVKADKTEVESLRTELKSAIQVVQDQADKLSTKMNKPGFTTERKGFGEVFGKQIEENFDRIKAGNPFSMEVKAVADMGLANIGGANEALPTIQSGIVTKPGQALNFTDIVSTVPSATGLYWIYKETTSEGAIDDKAEGANASQIDYDFAKEVNNIGTIAGYAAVSEELIQDMHYVQNVLPQLLLRDLAIKQNAKFSTALMAAISAGSSAATVDVEQLVDTIAELEEANYNVNGIVMKPSNFARLYKTKDTNGLYNLPNVVSIAPNGGVQVEGIGTYKANWGGITSNFAILGDWSLAKVVQAGAVTIKFFDNDFTLAKAGKVAVKISVRQSLALDNASGFRKVDLGLA